MFEKTTEYSISKSLDQKEDLSKELLKKQSVTKDFLTLTVFFFVNCRNHTRTYKSNNTLVKANGRLGNRANLTQVTPNFLEQPPSKRERSWCAVVDRGPRQTAYNRIC